MGPTPGISREALALLCLNALPRLSVRCEYPNTAMAPTEVTFGISPRYGLLTALEAHEWFIRTMREHEEFEVETERAGELPMPYWSETVRRVVVK